MGLATSTTDASAIDAYYAVRSRSVASATRPASITWEDVWKERRLEMAMEGDRWYDYVRLSYYDAQRAITELKSQRRNSYWGLDAVYKEYYTNGTYTVTSSQLYNTQDPIPNVTKSSFTLPLPTEDLVFNPTLMDEPIHVDIRNTYSY